MDSHYPAHPLYSNTHNPNTRLAQNSMSLGLKSVKKPQDTIAKRRLHRSQMKKPNQTRMNPARYHAWRDPNSHSTHSPQLLSRSTAIGLKKSAFVVQVPHTNSSVAFNSLHQLEPEPAYVNNVKCCYFLFPSLFFCLFVSLF